jgi:hypothetical protein
MAIIGNIPYFQTDPSGAGANPKEDWEDMEDWFLKDKRDEEKKNTPQKRTQK